MINNTKELINILNSFIDKSSNLSIADISKDAHGKYKITILDNTPALSRVWNHFSGNQKSNIVNDESIKSIKQFVKNKTKSGEYVGVDGRSPKDRREGIKRVLNKILGSNKSPYPRTTVDNKSFSVTMTADDMEDLYTNLLLIKDKPGQEFKLSPDKNTNKEHRGSITSLGSLGKFGELE